MEGNFHFYRLTTLICPSVILIILSASGISLNANALIQGDTTKYHEFAMHANKFKESEQFDNALILYQKAYDGFIANKHYRRAIKMLKEIDHCYTFDGDFKAAKKVLSQALQLTKKHLGEHSIEHIDLLANKGISLAIIGEYKPAKQYLVSALLLYKRHIGQPTVLLGSMYNMYNFYYLQQNQNDSARYFGEKALALAKAIHVPVRNFMLISLNLATAQLERDNYIRVHEIYDSIDQCVTLLPANSLQAFVYFGKAGFYQKIGDFPRANNYYEKAKSIFGSNIISYLCN